MQVKKRIEQAEQELKTGSCNITVVFRTALPDHKETVDVNGFRFTGTPAECDAWVEDNYGPFDETYRPIL